MAERAVPIAHQRRRVGQGLGGFLGTCPAATTCAAARNRRSSIDGSGAEGLSVDDRAGLGNGPPGIPLVSDCRRRVRTTLRVFGCCQQSSPLPPGEGQGVRVFGLGSPRSPYSRFSAASRFGKPSAARRPAVASGNVPVNPWHTAAMDWGLVGALIWFRPRGRFLNGRIGPLRPLRVAGVAAISILSGGPVGFAMAFFHPTTLSDVGSLTGDGNVVVLEPERWVGKQLPLFGYIDIGQQLTTGDWTVVLYRRGCPDCQAVLREYELRLGQGASLPRVALVEIPPFGPNLGGERNEGDAVLTGRMSDRYLWFLETPVVIALTDSVVNRVITADTLLRDAPGAFSLRRQR